MGWPLTLASALLVGGLWAVQRWPGEDWWVGALLTWGPQVQWLAPPVLALLLTLMARRGMLAFVNLVVTAFALFALAGFEMNDYGAPAPGEGVVRVATWNVYGHTREREVVRERILSWDCDIVCLQESADPAYRELLPGYESTRAGDLRVFVRGAILSRRVISGARPRPQVVLVVEADTCAGPVVALTTHVPRARRSRPVPREITPLADYVREGMQVREAKFEEVLGAIPHDRPMILAGDLNTPPTSRYWYRLSQRLTDAFDAAGRGFGHTFLWRRRWPLLRIDYVWAGGGARPLRCWVERAAPSDHRPVLAEIALPPARDSDGNLGAERESG
ncbi:MAG: endonuclease/exonuclease/phosphatase family protein [Armatimonadota bacterium]